MGGIARVAGRLQYAVMAAAVEAEEMRGIVERLGLEAGIDEPDAWIALDDPVRYWQELVTASGDPHVALHAPGAMSLKALDVILPLMRACPNLRTAIVSAGQFLPILHDGLRVSLEVEDQVATFRLQNESEKGLHGYLAECTVTICLRIARLLLSGFSALEVELPHDGTAPLDEYPRIFGCPVLFGNGNAVVIRFAEKWLDEPLAHADEHLFALLHEHASQVRNETPAQRDEATLIRNAYTALAGTEPKLEAVATYAGVSAEGVKKHLRELGLDHRQRNLVAIRESAEEMLRTGELTIAEIAERLGYSDVSSFSRAFRRWTGTSPSRWRRAEVA